MHLREGFASTTSHLHMLIVLQITVTLVYIENHSLMVVYQMGQYTHPERDCRIPLQQSYNPVECCVGVCAWVCIEVHCCMLKYKCA